MELLQLDNLRQEHARLCGELAVLEKAEREGEIQSPQTLRDICARLTLRLREHMHREELLPAIHSHSLGAAETNFPGVTHYNDYRYLQVLTRHVTLENRPFLLNGRYRMLADFLRGLRRHMDEQEALWN